MLKIGLIGCGGWASSMHIPALATLQSLGQINVAAVCDINPELAQAASKRLGDVPYFTNTDQMFSETKLSALSILSPVRITEQLIELAVAKQIPFLTEKPPATSAHKQQELIKQVGTLLHVVAYNRRFAPYTHIARGWLASETLQSVSAQFSRHRRRDKPFSNTFVHGLDAVLSFTGPLASLQAMITEQDDVLNLSVQFLAKNNCLGQLLVTPNSGIGLEHYQIRSAKRYAEIAFPQFGMHDLPGYVSCYENNVRQQHHSAAELNIAVDDMPSIGGIINEYRHLSAVIENGETSRSTLSDTLQTQQIREFLDQQGLGRCELHFD